MRRATCAALAAFPCFAAAPLQAAQTPRIGEAVQIVNEVRAEYDQDRRDLRRGDAVHQDEIIEVGADSRGELVLADETKLALGAGSRLLLDNFVHNGRKSNGDIVLNLVKGTFRFVTGIASKSAYRIRTPAAAITVRGTIFDVYIGDDRAIWILLMEGAIRACNDQGTCRALDRPGQILRVAPNGDLGRPSAWAGQPGRNAIDFDTAFPFVVSAPGIDPNPKFSRDNIVLGTFPAPPKGKPPGKRDTGKGAPPRIRETRPTREPRYTEIPRGPSGFSISIGPGIGRGFGGHRPGGGMTPKPPPRMPSINRKY